MGTSRSAWPLVILAVLGCVLVALFATAPAVHDNPPAKTCRGVKPPPGIYARATAAVPYVGNSVSGMPIGHLLGGSVRVQTVRCKKGVEWRWYGYGRVTYGRYGRWGNGQRCGWVRVVRDPAQALDLQHEAPVILQRQAAVARDRCDVPSRTVGGLGESDLFAADSWKNGTGRGTTQPAAIKKRCAVYANYDPASPGRFLDREGVEVVGRGTPGYRATNRDRAVPGFGTRYMTRDKRAILIKDTSLDTKHRTKWYFIRSACVDGEITRGTLGTPDRVRRRERR